MSHRETMPANKDILQITHTREDACTVLSNKLMSWVPSPPQEYIVLCIGTDRSTGDSLGPLTGTFLSEINPQQLHVYGTLNKPVHAKNLSTSIQQIKDRHKQPFIIAIDACLGKQQSIGSIIAGKGPIKPGAALKKTLPLIGDVHLTGVVNIGGFMDFSVLQNTRLSIVVDMARKLVSTLHRFDMELYNNHYISTIIQKNPSTTFHI